MRILRGNGGEVVGRLWDVKHIEIWRSSLCMMGKTALMLYTVTLCDGSGYRSHAPVFETDKQFIRDLERNESKGFGEVSEVILSKQIRAT